MGKAAAPTPVATAEEQWQAAKAGAQNWYLDQAKNALNMLAGSTGNPLALLGGKALSLGLDRLQAPEPTAEPGSFRDYQLRGSYDFMQRGATFLATTVPIAAGGFGLGRGAPGFSLARGSADAAAEGVGAGTVGAMRRLEFDAATSALRHPPGIARGDISAGPINGQAALDLSVEISATTARRVGIDYVEGQFVVFDEHTAGAFHGHVRSWADLTQGMQSALRRAGMADAKGNILIGGD